MASKIQFPAKGTLPDNQYDKALAPVKDMREKPIKVGDVVAYSTCSRCVCPVDFGKIVDIELGFEPEWVQGTPQKASWGGVTYVGSHHRPNYNKVIANLKIKPDHGGTLQRKPDYVAKVEQ